MSRSTLWSVALWHVDRLCDGFEPPPMFVVAFDPGATAQMRKEKVACFVHKTWMPLCWQSLASVGPPFNHFLSQGWNRRSGLMRFLIWCYRYVNWQQRMSGLTRPEASAEVYTCSEHPINHTASCRDRRCLIRLMLPSTCFNTCSSIVPLTHFQLLRDWAWPYHKDYNSPTVRIVHLKDVTKGYTLTRKWR